MILLELLFEMIFLPLLDNSYNAKMPKWLRIIIGFIIFMLFIVSIASLTVYSLLITEVGIVKRVIAGVFDLFLILYLGYTIKQSFKKR
ncbi:MAG: hypothetical protein Q4A78_10425 [Peptostreptococcaceae bacterium]|nr:hypothetical protein [Peptostreptococcaceae bacterium]